MQTTVLKLEEKLLKLSILTSRILSGLSLRRLSLSLSLPLLSFLSFSLARHATARSWFALSGASRTADEDAPVLLQTPLSRLSFLSSLALILARFLAFLRCLAWRVSF